MLISESSSSSIIRYIYIYIYVYLYTYVYNYVFLYVYIYICLYLYIHIYIYTYAYKYLYLKYLNRQAHQKLGGSRYLYSICIHVCRIYIYVYIYTYMNIHTYTYISTHIWIYMYILFHLIDRNRRLLYSQMTCFISPSLSISSQNHRVVMKEWLVKIHVYMIDIYAFMCTYIHDHLNLDEYRP
jgi:hypothetical protein